MKYNVPNSIKNEIINIRREIHRHPELSFEEYNTSKICADFLRKLGIEVTEGIAKTGVMGILRGKNNGKTILLRADMDALPIEEKNTHSFISENIGVMHACGHDIHVATLLLASYILANNKDKLNGNVKIIFQPAEEGAGGALPMIEEGILKNPDVDGAMAYHIWDKNPLGTVLIKNGGTMASPDHFFITIHGKGGHGANPEICVNPLSIAAEMITTLHEITTKGDSVISMCAINGGTFENIIPDELLLKGTARTTDKETRMEMYNKIREIVENVPKQYGGTAELDYHFLYPPCVNDDKMTDLFKETAERVLGKENVISQEKCDMTGEDFAYFSEYVPSCFVKLGGAKRPLHTSNFDADEEAIFIGAELMAEFAIDFLKK